MPIAQDGAYDRLQEHLNEGWEITSVIMTPVLRFYATLTRELEPIIIPMPSIPGVDINSSRLAVSITNPRTGKALRQLYLGEDIYVRQIRYGERRAKIMRKKDKLHSGGARKALDKISGKQRGFARTRTWQVVGEIVRLAREYHAAIAVEDLKGLRKR